MEPNWCMVDLFENVKKSNRMIGNVFSNDRYNQSIKLIANRFKLGKNYHSVNFVKSLCDFVQALLTAWDILNLNYLQTIYDSLKDVKTISLIPLQNIKSGFNDIESNGLIKGLIYTIKVNINDMDNNIDFRIVHMLCSCEQIAKALRFDLIKGMNIMDNIKRSYLCHKDDLTDNIKYWSSKSNISLAFRNTNVNDHVIIYDLRNNLILRPHNYKHSSNDEWKGCYF